MKFLLLLLIPFVAFADRNEVDDTATVACAEGESCVGRQTPQRSKHVNLRDNSGNELLGQKVASGSIPVVFPSDAPIVTVTNSQLQTYSAVAYGLTVASTPTDVFTITGSATKTIRVTDITLSGTKTANGFGDVLLIRRSTANSGGTSVTQTAIKYDTDNAAATAVVRSYTANPTLGTEVGKLAAHRYFYSGLSVAAITLDFVFGDTIRQNFTLRGTGEVLAVNLNSVTLSGNLLDVYVEWVEQ